MPDTLLERRKNKWSNRSLLKPIPNPSEDEYTITMHDPEVTFLGVPNQPDYAVVDIEISPAITVPELKSLKKYFEDFRNRTLSYERFSNTVYEDLMEVYKPRRLRLTVAFNVRGGISSKIVIDSNSR